MYVDPESHDDSDGALVDCRLWGKDHGLPAPYPLVCHLLDTAAMAGALLDAVFGAQRLQWLAEEVGVPVQQVRDVVMLWAGLHDIGKISPPFQSKVAELFAPIKDDARYVADRMTGSDAHFHHSEATQWILAELLLVSGYGEGKRGAGHQVAQMLGGHHGRYHAALTAQDLFEPRELRASTLGSGQWTRQCAAHVDVLRELIGGGASTVPMNCMSSQVLGVLTGLVVCADWLVSQTSFITAPGRMPGKEWIATGEDLRRHWLLAQRDATAEVAKAGLGRARFQPVPVDAVGFEKRFGFAPNPLQASLLRELSTAAAGPGLLLITAPPGDGKTEAAQLAAVHLNEVSGTGGIAFALPTMATTDAMFRRTRTFADRNLDGDASLALVHGMSWLNSDFEQLADRSIGDSRMATDAEGTAFATDWLRGSRRGILAALGSLTIDQLLTGVLPVKYNMLRMFGLSGKVVVIDEAHSYGPWMHSLLLRLLEWLGAMRVPVVVMSATLAGRTAREVVGAYRRGVLGKAPIDEATVPPYPGWLFVDAVTGEVGTAYEVGTDRERDLHVQTVPVRRPSTRDAAADAGDTGPAAAGVRLEVLAELLRPLPHEGGCVLVCCNTVAEAQETYRFLLDHFSGAPGLPVEIDLLHSRFQAQHRAAITRRSEAAFGKPAEGSEQAADSPRPQAAILIATQIVEQSIDLDFDLIVSDLAPIALLLQRAGRCWRHDRGPRPAWTGSGPRLVVLDPVGSDGAFAKPTQWGQVYFASLLSRTSILLRERADTPIQIPAQVQELVDAVYAHDFVDRLQGAETDEWASLNAADQERYGAELAESQLARSVAIKPPKRQVGDLATELSGLGSVGLLNEELLVTRLGADSARLVMVFRQPGGELSLDAHGKERLPGSDAAPPLVADQVRLVMQHTVPVPGWWVEGHGSVIAAPDSWAENPLLRGLVVLEGHVDPEQGWRSRASPLLTYDPNGTGFTRI